MNYKNNDSTNGNSDNSGDFVDSSVEGEEESVITILSGQEDNEIAGYKRRVDEMTVTAQRLTAEFDNYRKRTREQGRISKEEGRAEVIEKLLPVLDSFSQAVKIISDKNVLDGVNLIYDRLRCTLESFGVTKIDILGQEFNPEFMNAVFTRKEKGKSGMAIEVILDGYLMNGKVLRAATVIVGE